MWEGGAGIGVSRCHVIIYRKKMTHKVVSLLLCIAVSYATAQTGTRCPAVPGRSETCVCQHQEGVIDMTSLANKDNTPR